MCVDNSGNSGNSDGGRSVPTSLTLKLRVLLEYRDDLLDPTINIAFYMVWCFKFNLFIGALLHSDCSLYLLCSIVPIFMWLRVLVADDISFHLTTDDGSTVQLSVSFTLKSTLHIFVVHTFILTLRH